MDNLQLLLTRAVEDVIQLTSAHVPNLLFAVSILVLGWIAAYIVAGGIGKLVEKTRFEETFSESTGKKSAGSTLAARSRVFAFYLMMLFVLVGFFQTLGLTLMTEPLNEMLKQIFAYAPRILGALTLFGIAWVSAAILKKVIATALEKAEVDKRLSEQTGKKSLSISGSIADTVYWLIFLLMLPTVLNTLGLTDVLEPVNSMFNQVLSYLPNIFSAIVILMAGWLFAQILQRVTVNFLSATGADSFSQQLGLTTVLGENQLSRMVGMVVYVLVFFPVLIAALDALQMDALVGPASNMLDQILITLPAIFAAFLVVAIAYVVGRLVSTLVANVLQSMGFDNVMAWLGLSKTTQDTTRTPSNIVGCLALVSIVLFAAMEACEILGFHNLSDLLSQFVVFASQILVGLVIFAVGLVLSNVAARTIRETGTTQAHLLALMARVSILVLTGAMSLGQMGLATEIITLAFGILFGCIAVALAIAFGVGGRHTAERELEEWVKSLKDKKMAAR